MNTHLKSFLFNSAEFANELITRINHADDTITGAQTSSRFSVKSNISDFPSDQTSDLRGLAKLFRSRFSRAIVSSDGIANGRDIFSFCLLCQPLGNGTADVSKVPCMVEVRLEGTKVREVDLSINLYSLLLAEGRICLDPGVVNSASQRINREAGVSLIKAITTRTTIDERYRQGLWLHGRIELYEDISKNVDTRMIDINGRGRVGELLRTIAAEFKLPKIEMIKEISHDRTTTFKGRICTNSNPMSLRYELFIGFRSQADLVEECWFRIAPALTLMECVV